ncbi:hypothetical protein N7478_006496 [Penicillium angulare]|uniref:uncharacterized protein n=1 Tax=Penicillium angulare TaxID=116970 RepID=UPI0025406D44|nr:uncharacterized protein N7478_006496 [Penicillium angulare]KAJ5281124.1 hypothetical protein N7478_006496 [Penicillium angulare]
MSQYSRSDYLEAGSLTRSRSTSFSSDSQHPRINLMSPPTVSPPPGFISASAASEIITSDQAFNAADFVAEDEQTGASANALVTPAALSLLNGFLDNLLFNVLGASKSTQLACIRPILADVLKPRLAQEVVTTADEELCEYMGGEEDEKTEFRGGQEPGGDFDLVRSWKLTRLRCMVYTRLGDMEEEDEDEFIAQDGLGEADGAPRRFSSHVDNITPAAAIFLTSIIEHIGERALVIAGETARSRLSSKLNGTESHVSDDLEDNRKRIERLVVEDLDMEKLALNATLGRLWRTWRQRRRSTTLSRTLSRESFRRRNFSNTLAGSRKSSIATIEEPVTPKEFPPEEVPAPVDPATVPLPIGDYDVQEIEIPGYNPDMESEVIQTMQAVVAHKVRPRSLMVVPSPSLVSRTGNSPLSASAIDSPTMQMRHARSRSLPNQKSPPPARELQGEESEDEAKDEGSPRASPNSARSSRSSSKEKQLETMYEDDESAEFVDASETTTGLAITTEVEESKEIAPESPEKARMSVVEEEEEEHHGEPEDAQALNITIASLRSRLREDDAATDHTDSNANSNRVSVDSSLGDRLTNDPEVIEGRGMREKPTLTSNIQRPRRKPSRDVSQSNAKPIIAETSDLDAPPATEIPQPTQGIEPTEPTLSPPENATIEAITPPSDNGIFDYNKDTPISDMTPVSEIAPAIEEPVSKISSEENISEQPPAVQEPSEEKPLEEQHTEETLSASAFTPESTFVPGVEPSAAEFAAVAGDITPSELALTPELGPVHSAESVSASETPRPASTSGDSQHSTQSRTRHRPTPLVVTASNRSSPSLEQRAAVQRMSTRPSTSVSSSIVTKSQRSESFSSARDKRPVTAGSTTSQVSNKIKGLMIRPPGDSPSMRVRSSSETSRASGSADSLENDTTDLDKLINSDETIHFTLTPRSVREMTFPDLPRPIPRSDTTDTSDLAEFLKNTGPPGADPRVSLSSKTTGADSMGPDSPKHIPLSTRMTLSPKPQTGPSRGSRGSTSNAEFVKSSGPTSAPSLNGMPIDSPKSPKSSKSASSPRARSSMSSTASRSNPNKPRLQARPAETRGSETSDLIDFIRQGPPQSGAHRIPRNVAPFRNTIDSDDLPFDSPQNGSLVSTRETSTPNKSMTSIGSGSRTGLLDSANRANGQTRNPTFASQSNAEDPRPQRKQRRVPDPYAIDDDDDDDEMLEELINATPQKPQRQEESLIDFLRSEPPPDFDSTPQLLSTRPPATSGNMKSRLLSGKGPSSKMSISSMRSQNSNVQAQSNYSIKVGRERNPGNIPSTSHKQTETDALADFLRNTGPPEPVPRSPKPKEGGFSRFFSRRKKVEA